MTGGFRLLLAAGLALSTAAPAAGQADLPSLFPRRAPVTAPAGALVRLDVPPEVLAACRPDLSDLRLVGTDGREVPYAVLEGLAPDRTLEVRETAPAKLIGAERTTAAPDPGDERGPPHRIERFILAAPPPAPGGERWDLVLTTGRRELVRRATVADLGEAGNGDAENVADAGAMDARRRGEGRLLWSGSVFRLPAGAGVREGLRIPLPLRPATGGGAAGSDERSGLLVVLEGQDDQPVEPGFRYERVREISGPARTRVPLRVLSTSRVDGVAHATVVEVERPRGVVPDRIEIETSTPAFDRRVRIWDRGPGGEGLLGWGSVRRAGGGPDDGDLGVALRPPRGDRLRLEIEDGDSPPLDDLRIFAAVRRPALVFALPGGADAGGAPASATLYFGGGRALAPRYDLQGLAPAPSVGARAAAAERLYDPARLPAAELRTAGPNPRFVSSPALTFAMHPGAAIETGRWAWRRSLEAKPSPEGLVRLRLAPEDLAHARDDLGDLRIVGGPPPGGAADGPRQWAYLLGDSPASDSWALEVASVETDDGATRYELAPPAVPVPIERLTLRVDTSFFDRPFVLEGRRGDRSWRLADGRLAMPPHDPGPVEISFANGPARVDRLVLTIENGNDAPLDLTSASAWLPLPEIYFATPEGAYELLLGNPRAEAPRYELARVRDVVLTVSAGEAEAGALEPNPGHRPGLGALLSPRVQTIFLWTVLALAVVGLAVITLRLARREES